MSKIAESVFLAEGSIIRGDVTIGDDSGVWYNAVIRGDLDTVEIGCRSNVQDNVVIHTDSGFPVRIGDCVTIGHGAVVHGCTVGDNTVVGMGAVVMNGASIGKNCVVAAGALVPGGMEIPDGHLAVGCPCRVKRTVLEEEIAANIENAEEYVELARSARRGN